MKVENLVELVREELENGTKRCSRSTVILPATSTYFARDPSRPDGLDVWSKEAKRRHDGERRAVRRMLSRAGELSTEQQKTLNAYWPSPPEEPFVPLEHVLEAVARAWDRLLEHERIAAK